jgi:endonuclease/exonuclease/phosphatase (EEP) superfamily protein YafD
VALVAAALFGIGRRWLECLAAGAVALLNLALVAPLYLGSDERAVGAAPIRVIFLNVHTENSRTDRVVSFVKAERPDILALLEVNHGWIEELGDVRALLPHYREEPREDNFGIAFYSRHPIETADVIRLGEFELPSIIARLRLDGQRLHVVATHPLPPVSIGRWEARNEHLRLVASHAKELEGETILVGDLNVTSWSSLFRGFVRDSGLRDARKGFGLRPSWPSFFPPMGIPIDHALVSSGIVVHRFRCGPNLGSDHYPVVVDCSIRP